MHATEPEAKHGDQKKRGDSTRVADPATILPEEGYRQKRAGLRGEG